MPTYTYACEHGHEFETEQRITDEPLTECTARVPCPGTRQIRAYVACGGPVRRLISRTSFVLEGRGWSKDGYSR